MLYLPVRSPAESLHRSSQWRPSEAHACLEICFFLKFPSFAFSRLVATENSSLLHQNSHIWAIELSRMQLLHVHDVCPWLKWPHDSKTWNIQVMIQQEWRTIQKDREGKMMQGHRAWIFCFEKTSFIYSSIQPSIFLKHTPNRATAHYNTSILPTMPPATKQSLQPFPPN